MTNDPEEPIDVEFDQDRPPPWDLLDLTDEEWQKALLKECSFWGGLRLLASDVEIVETWEQYRPPHDPSLSDLVSFFRGDNTALPENAASELGLPPNAKYRDAVKCICDLDEWASKIEFTLRERAKERERGVRDDNAGADWRKLGF